MVISRIPIPELDFQTLKYYQSIMQDGDLLASMKGNRVPNHNHVHTFSLLYGVYPAEQTSFVLGLLANQLVCYFGKKNATKLNTVRPRDTRPQAARTSTVHDFELGPKNLEKHVFLYFSLQIHEFLRCTDFENFSLQLHEIQNCLGFVSPSLFFIAQEVGMPRSWDLFNLYSRDLLIPG